MILIAIGNGSIRACVTSLGGSQFDLPSQSQSLDRYFSHYYFVYTFGILLSKIIPPEIRVRIQCFGQSECYAAVFGTLGIVFVAAWSKQFSFFMGLVLNYLFFSLFFVLPMQVIFLLGMFLYKQEMIGQNRNILFQVFGCICYGIRYKLKNVRNHTWIDETNENYTPNFVEDVYAVLKVRSQRRPIQILH